jgi:predicted dehydrogenase
MTIRWGILSTGNIAHSFTRGLRAVKDAQIVAVGSRSQKSADDFGKEFNIPHRYATYEALAADPDVDAIYIGTPHPMHFENALMCIRAGKAVLCEKPFTMNARELETLIREARAHKVFLMEAMWTRFTPVMGRIRQLLSEGALGDVRMLLADFCFRADFNPKHRLFDPALGGGALLDVGIYPVSFSFMVFGAPQELQSSATMGETGVDEIATMLFRYSNGQHAQLSCGSRVQSPMDASILGTKGMIRIAVPWWKPQQFTIQYPGKDPEVVNLPFIANGYEYEAIEVNRCLHEGMTESPIMPLDESLTIMRTLDSIRAQWGLTYPADKVTR